MRFQPSNLAIDIENPEDNYEFSENDWFRYTSKNGSQTCALEFLSKTNQRIILGLKPCEIKKQIKVGETVVLVKSFKHLKPNKISVPEIENKKEDKIKVKANSFIGGSYSISQWSSELLNDLSAKGTRIGFRSHLQLQPWFRSVVSFSRGKNQAPDGEKKESVRNANTGEAFVLSTVYDLKLGSTDFDFLVGLGAMSDVQSGQMLNGDFENRASSGGLLGGFKWHLPETMNTSIEFYYFYGLLINQLTEVRANDVYVFTKPKISQLNAVINSQCLPWGFSLFGFFKKSIYSGNELSGSNSLEEQTFENRESQIGIGLSYSFNGGF